MGYDYIVKPAGWTVTMENFNRSFACGAIPFVPKNPLTLIRIGFHYYTGLFTILQVFYCRRHYPIYRKYVRLPGRHTRIQKTGRTSCSHSMSLSGKWMPEDPADTLLKTPVETVPKGFFPPSRLVIQVESTAPNDRRMKKTVHSCCNTGFVMYSIKHRQSRARAHDKYWKNKS
ncbi:MAG: hypothetical protein LIQ30_05925 [Planctomycetes bacterium]|nr:hypothetical protein [Planctomycetota bacterium]MCD7895309.1 hypothetical protein [Planctomycetaceae bacterium]